VNLAALVYDLDTGEVVRIVWPSVGEDDSVLDNPNNTLFALDPARRWGVRKVDRDSEDAALASSGVISGKPFKST
jgi:hypothetical protein